MKIEDLIGYQLVSIDEEKVVVKKEDKQYTLRIYEDEGECCGFNEIKTSLLITNEELNRNPIITNVTVEEEHEESWDHEGERCKITFFGELKALADIESYSGSGSGYYYGASVSLVCDALELNECLTSW